MTNKIIIRENWNSPYKKLVSKSLPALIEAETEEKRRRGNVGVEKIEVVLKLGHLQLVLKIWLLRESLKERGKGKK